MKDLTLDNLVSILESNEKPIIFLLHGYAGVGKDTLANWLMDQILTSKYPIRKMHYATGLKKMSLDLVHFIHDTFLLEFEKTGVEVIHEKPMLDHFYDVEKKNERFYSFLYPDWTPRKCMQWLGTDLIRAYDPDFFVRYMVQEIKKGESVCSYIIPDWRFKNERSLLNEMFGDQYDIYDIHVTRESFTVLNEGLYQHRSEQDVPIETIGYHVLLPELRLK
jgi:hypothetical protein